VSTKQFRCQAGDEACKHYIVKHNHSLRKINLEVAIFISTDSISNGFDMDDDEYMDIDVESEDEWRSSFPRKPKYVHHHKRPGGPERPDTSGMTASMAKDARRS
jgi:hypothetical protein